MVRVVDRRVEHDMAGASIVFRATCGEKASSIRLDPPVFGSCCDSLTCVFFRRADDQHPSRVSDGLGAESMTNSWFSVEDEAMHRDEAMDSVCCGLDGLGLPAHRIGRLWKFMLAEVDARVRADEATANEVAAGGMR